MRTNHAHKYQEVEVKTASATELVVLLYDAAIASLQKAQEHLAVRDIAGRVRCLNKAISILTELQANLNFEAGGEIAFSLERLYGYMKDRIFQANLHQDAAPLKEMVRLLSGLRASWAEVARKQAEQSTRAEAQLLPGTAAIPIAQGGTSASSTANLNITA
jgi:flagellar protein FliS